MRRRGGVLVIILAVHLGEPGSIPGGVAPGFSMSLVEGFSRGYPVFFPSLHSGASHPDLTSPSSALKILTSGLSTGISQATQTVPIPSSVLELEGRQSEARQELVFRAVDIPPLGLRIYRMSRASTTATTHQPVASSYISNDVSHNVMAPEYDAVASQTQRTFTKSGKRQSDNGHSHSKGTISPFLLCLLILSVPNGRPLTVEKENISIHAVSQGPPKLAEVTKGRGAIRTGFIKRGGIVGLVFWRIPDSAILITVYLGLHEPLEYLTVHIDSETGLLSKMVAEGSEVTVQQNMYYYDAYAGLNGGVGTRSNGAYVFKPRSSTATQISAKATYSVYKGDLVEEIHQKFNDWTSQVIRVYKGEEHAELEWLVGPIPTYGTQPISRFSSSLRSEGVFHTDSNGRELLRRKRNYRESWNVTITQDVSGNYYPVTSRIVLKDEQQGLELAVLTDRSQGGSSLADGQIELLLHRRLRNDDGLGVNEALDDDSPARGKHYVVVGRSSGDTGYSLAARQRLLALRKLLQPWLFLSSTADWPASFVHQLSGLQNSLPENVHLLTLEPWGESAILLRLEHIMEKNDDSRLSANVTVDVKRQVNFRMNTTSCFILPITYTHVLQYLHVTRHRTSLGYRTTVHASAAGTDIAHTTSLPCSNSTEQLTITAVVATCLRAHCCAAKMLTRRIMLQCFLQSISTQCIV
ncbi:hypothetical protein PR048_029573 [Dryococelus australis]|uniref:Glycosyl hydrolase family 38 C-terminal domain-containing protein n=1 Tax=Dryococelus australis TaxID=614101 RepID=A0ABQ9GDS1_9NEOP|nr:hypothetical protein PR048_029573 [Dryococelus australis]